MTRAKVHVADLVRRYNAERAEWAYIEDPDHVTKGVMCWVVTLFNVTMPKWEDYYPRRVREHVIKLGTGADLVVDEYVADLVWARLEQANETT